MKSKEATYTGFEFEVEGYPALAIINKDLKDLENRDQYPYSVFIEIIPDAYNENGHPETEEYEYLLEIEKHLIDYFEEHTQTVHVGHTTVYRRREIIFYTGDSEMVQDYLDYYLPTIERESHFELEQDSEWENVSGFYELL